MISLCKTQGSFREALARFLQAPRASYPRTDRHLRHRLLDTGVLEHSYPSSDVNDGILSWSYPFLSGSPQSWNFNHLRPLLLLRFSLKPPPKRTHSRALFYNRTDALQGTVTAQVDTVACDQAMSALDPPRCPCPYLRSPSYLQSTFSATIPGSSQVLSFLFIFVTQR